MLRLSQKILSDLFNLIFPAFCLCCHNTLKQGRSIICENCFSRMDRVTPEHIAAFLERVDNKYFDDIFIKYHFSEILQMLMHYYKYQGYLVIADYFAASVAEVITGDYNLITSVPLHPSKKRERGFNQSKILAKKISLLTKIEYSELLERTRFTLSQTKMSRSQRQENIHDAFNILEDVKDKSVLVVDDVITTAATLNECSRILKEAQAKKVDVLALATPVDILQEQLESEILLR